MFLLFAQMSSAELRFTQDMQACRSSARYDRPGTAVAPTSHRVILGGPIEVPEMLTVPH
jgi:hypothetical protein